MADKKDLGAMNLAETIPLFFYDLIARVVPGFLFLLAMRVGLKGTPLEIEPLTGMEAHNFVDSVLGGASFLTICYACGWILQAWKWPDLCRGEDRTLRTKYQEVRLQHPEAGFRLVKLRAEARLLGSARNGMWLSATAVLTTLALLIAGIIRVADITVLSWCIRILAPLIASLAFLALEPAAWRAYCGNVELVHDLVIRQGFPKVTNVEQGRALDGD